jgi:hypothetical protein
MHINTRMQRLFSPVPKRNLFMFQLTCSSEHKTFLSFTGLNKTQYQILWDGEFAINQSRQKAKALNTKQLSNREL